MTTDTTIQNISDLALASFLLAKGHKLLGTQRGENGRVTFSFEDDILQDMLDYYNREATVEPLTFAETMRNLKGLIHQRRS